MILFWCIFNWNKSINICFLPSKSLLFNHLNRKYWICFTVHVFERAKIHACNGNQIQTLQTKNYCFLSKKDVELSLPCETIATMATERLTLIAAFKVIRMKHMKIKVYLVPHPLGFCCLSIAVLNVFQVCILTVNQSPSINNDVKILTFPPCRCENCHFLHH